MLSKLLARITGADKRKKYPQQQTSSLGRLGDSAIVSPYGLYADLPTDTLLKHLGGGMFMSVTVDRPSDMEQGEPVFFHPFTGTRIIARNNGDLDILTGDGDTNLTTTTVNIIASGDINATVTGNASVDVGGAVDLTASNMTATVTGSTIFDTPTTTFTGAVTINGATSLANVTSNGVNIGSTHTHTQPNDSGGNTEFDTGVPQ